MKEREAQLAKSSRVSLEGLAEQIKQAGVKDLNLIVKGDVQGSVEVIADSLQRMSTEKVRVRVLHSGVGAITESDVLLASASNAVIIGFNVRPERKAAGTRRAGEGRDPPPLHHLRAAGRDRQGDVRTPRARLQGELRRPRRGAQRLQDHQGRSDRRLHASRDGLIKRDAQVRVLREGAEVWKGKIASLKRFKDDVSEVRRAWSAVSISAASRTSSVGDIIEAFTTEKMAAELGQNTADLKRQQMAELKEAKQRENEVAAAAPA